jgi:hypothetical protein
VGARSSYPEWKKSWPELIVRTQTDEAVEFLQRYYDVDREVISTNRPNSSMPYTDTPTTTPKLSVPPPRIHIGSPPKIHANRDTLRRGHPHRLGLMTWPSERKRRHESKQRRTCDV